MSGLDLASGVIALNNWYGDKAAALLHLYTLSQGHGLHEPRDGQYELWGNTLIALGEALKAAQDR